MPEEGEETWEIFMPDPKEVENDEKRGGPMVFPLQPAVADTLLLSLNDEYMEKVLEEISEKTGQAEEDVHWDYVLKINKHQQWFNARSGEMPESVRANDWGLNLFSVRKRDDGLLELCSAMEGENYSPEELMEHVEALQDAEYPALAKLSKEAVQLKLHAVGGRPPWHALAHCTIQGVLPDDGQMTARRVNGGGLVTVKWSLAGQTGPMGEYRPVKHLVWRLRLPEMGHEGCALALWCSHHAAVSPLHRHGGRGKIVLDRYLWLGLMSLGAHM